MKAPILFFALSLFLTACSGHYKHPTSSKNPAKMSSDTLCFRYESAKDPALGAEITRRRLDCDAILADDPFYSDPSYGGGRY